MDIVYERCCGVDVHKKLIVACLRNGKKSEVKSYGTVTEEIKRLGCWLVENDCQMIAMESTGAYWKPIYNIFELLDLDAMVVNAQHMKAVPGRKTDKKDAEWIAELLQHGLLKSSFIPDKDQRELRDVVRYRKSMVEERSREINRLEKTLEGANIKLSSYVSDLTGKSSRKLLDKALDSEVTEENIGDLLCGNGIQQKQECLLKAMDGVLTDVQKKLIRLILDHIDDMTKRINDLDNIINCEMDKYEDAIKRIEELPGIGRRSAEVIVSEIGINMDRFPTAAHLASWCGLSPGNNESAGKRKSGKTNKGNKSLKTTMIQCAKSAKKNENSFFKAQYDRIVVRRGKNRAAVAVAHSMIIAIYYMLNNNTNFQDLGSDYYTKFNTDAKTKYLLGQLEKIGRPAILLPA